MSVQIRKQYKKCFEVYMINWVWILFYRWEKPLPKEKKTKKKKKKKKNKKKEKQEGWWANRKKGVPGRWWMNELLFNPLTPK